MARFSFLTVLVVMIAVATVPTFGAMAPWVELISTEATTTVPNPNIPQDAGEFSIRIRVTALDADVYMNNNISPETINFPSFGGTNDYNGRALTIINSLNYSPPPTQNGNDLWWLINEGQSRDFRIISYFTPRQTGGYSFQLREIGWSPTPSYPAYPLALGEDFRTEFIFLRAVPEPATLALLGAPLLALWRRRRK